MIKYCCLFGFSMAFVFHTHGQPVPDTSISLGAFTVTEQVFSTAGVGSPQQQLDSLDHIIFQTEELSQVLSSRSTIFIKNYGPGTLSTPALRGSSPAQTALLWNGVLINSPMNGQLDLSLLPVQFFEEIEVHYGSSSAIWGSGAVGGALKLSNNTQTWEPLSAGAYFGYSSLKNQQRGFHFTTGKHRLKFKLSAFQQDNQNAFKYINPYSEEEETQIHNHRKSTQVYSSASYTTKNDQWLLSAHFWHQAFERQLPPTLLQDTSSANQYDQANRAMFTAKTLSKNPIVFQYAYIDEYIRYEDESINVNDPSRAISHIGNLSYTNQWNEKNQLKIGFNYTGSLMDGENYPDSISFLPRAALFAGNQTRFNKHLRMNALLRQEYFNGVWMPLSGFVSMVYEKPTWSLQTSVARSYRIPTMNDLYWVPGGNPNLEGEYGPSANLTLAWTALEWNTYNLTWTNSIYGRRNKNEIVWVNQGPYWTPENLKNVVALGWESSLQATKSFNHSDVSLFLQSAWVKAENTQASSSSDRSVGHQLMYTPHWLYNGEIRHKRKNTWIFFRQNFVGKRYYSTDNEHELESYSLSSAGTGFAKSFGMHHFRCSLAVQNIFNTDYQTVAQQAMPLRYYQINITYQITQRDE